MKMQTIDGDDFCYGNLKKLQTKGEIQLNRGIIK